MVDRVEFEVAAAVRTCWKRRPKLTKAPSLSSQDATGSTTFAWRAVAERNRSGRRSGHATTSGHRDRARPGGPSRPSGSVIGRERCVTLTAVAVGRARRSRSAPGVTVHPDATLTPGCPDHDLDPGCPDHGCAARQATPRGRRRLSDESGTGAGAHPGSDRWPGSLIGRVRGPGGRVLVAAPVQSVGTH